MEHKNAAFWTVRSDSRVFGKLLVKTPQDQGQEGINRVINIGKLDKIKPPIPQHASSFLNTYFDFGYYFCVTPFRFKADPFGAYGYNLHKNRVQQVSFLNAKTI